jgi:PhnB protein
MQVSFHLSFKGDCEAAFQFYERALGGKIISKMTYAESPMGEQVPAEWRNKIVHATLSLENATLLASDQPPDHFEPAKGFALTLAAKDPGEAERFYKALSEKANITMPLQKTFWSPAFAMLTDQFGIPWMINSNEAQ